MKPRHLIGPEYGHKSANDVIDRADDKLQLKSVMDALAARDEQIKTFATKAKSEIDTHGRMLDETKSALEKIAGEGSRLQTRLTDVEQKLARRGGQSDHYEQPVSAKFVAGDEFKALQARGKGSARLSVKTVTSITSATSGTGGVGDAIRPNRTPGIVTAPQRELTIRDLIMPGRTDSNSVEYVKETGYQNLAAAVAEGALKPQSDLAFDLLTSPVRTLAHWFLASKQVLADIPLLQSYIDTRAIYGLKYVEEAQILAGDGTGQNLLGMIPQATAYAFATYSAGADTKLDRVRRAMLQV